MALDEKGSLIEVIRKLKEQGVTRFIGYSGHTEAEAMKFMADKGNIYSTISSIEWISSFGIRTIDFPLE